MREEGVFEDLVVLGVHVLDQLDAAVGVTDLVIVPGDQLDEGVRKGNTSLSIENGGVGVTNEVSRDDLILGVAHNSLHLTLGSLLDGGLDLLVRGRGGEAGGQIDDGDIGGGDTESHTGQLAVKGGDDLADGLGGTGGGGDDVGTGATAAAPVLARGTIDGLLGGGGGVDGGHESLGDAEVVVDDLGERGQAVGGAGSVRDDVVLGLVGIQVDSADEHGGISRGGRDDDLLGTTLQVEGGLLDGGENTGRFDDVLGTSSTPLDLLGLQAIG